MKREKKLIIRLLLVFVLISSCLSFKSVFAADPTVTFDFTPEEGDSIDDLVVDLYKIADIEWDDSPTVASYVLKKVSTDFTMFSNDMDIGSKLDDKGAETNPQVTTEKLDELRSGALGVVAGKEATLEESVDADGGTFSKNGLYLAVVRNDSIKDKTEYIKTVTDSDGKVTYVSSAYSETKEYRFSPLLLFIKDKDQNIVLNKYETEERFGKLKIVKVIDEFKEKVTFVFRVEANKKADFSDPVNKYEKVVVITADELNIEPYILENIPLGYYVRVTEEYSGASYKLANDCAKIQGPDQQLVIVPETKDGEIATVTFRNELSDLTKHGYGVDNKYEYTAPELSEETKNTEGTWTWTGNDLGGANE